MALRFAQARDSARLAELSDHKRTEYERFSPTFWRKAEGAIEAQTAFFKSLSEAPNVAVYVWDDGGIEGFIVGSLVSPPPVYEPGGHVCMVDDFVVAHAKLWHTVGIELLSAVRAWAEKQGASLAVVVCAYLDEPKRAMLRENGFGIASEWYVSPTWGG